MQIRPAVAFPGVADLFKEIKTMTAPTELYVTYLIRPRGSRVAGESSIPQSTTVTLPSTLVAKRIPDFVRERIRPTRAADPSDNYAGQSPDEVVILNMIRLESLM